MFRQPIHFAPGATPIWLPAPSSPTIVPMVWVPWLLSSQGTGERGARGPGPARGGRGGADGGIRVDVRDVVAQRERFDEREVAPHPDHVRHPVRAMLDAARGQVGQD